MQTDGFLVSREVLGRWEELLVLVREVLTTVMLEATEVVGEVLTVATGEDIEVGVVLMGGVEHSAGGGGGGKKDPLASGIGRTGLSAVPTTFPIPGKFLAADAAATA